MMGAETEPSPLKQKENVILKLLLIVMLQFELLYYFIIIILQSLGVSQSVIQLSKNGDCIEVRKGAKGRRGKKVDRTLWMGYR